MGLFHGSLILKVPQGSCAAQKELEHQALMMQTWATSQSCSESFSGQERAGHGMRMELGYIRFLYVSMMSTIPGWSKDVPVSHTFTGYLLGIQHIGTSYPLQMFYGLFSFWQRVWVTPGDAQVTLLLCSPGTCFRDYEVSGIELTSTLCKVKAP